MRTNQEDFAFGETCRYIHSNPVLSFITNLGYKVCTDIRQNKETVVDIGCGTGDFVPYSDDSRYLGLDLSKDFISNAKKRFPEQKFMVGDVYNLSFDNSSITSMVSFGFLEHLRDLNKALKEIKRVLSANGEFIFGIPTEGFLFRIGRNLTTKPHVERVTGVDYNALLKKEHVNKCKDILEELKKFFIIDKLVGVPFKLPIINLNIFVVGRCIKSK